MPEALFMVAKVDSQVQKRVNLADLVTSFPMSIYYFLAKFNSASIQPRKGLSKFAKNTF